MRNKKRENKNLKFTEFIKRVPQLKGEDWGEMLVLYAGIFFNPLTIIGVFALPFLVMYFFVYFWVGVLYPYESSDYMRDFEYYLKYNEHYRDHVVMNITHAIMITIAVLGYLIGFIYVLYTYCRDSLPDAQKRRKINGKAYTPFRGEK